MADYITDIIVVTGKNASVPAGYTKLPQDINKGAGGEYIYIGYQKGSSGSGVIGLQVVIGKNAPAPPNYEKIDVDLNKGAGGEYLYLCKRMGAEADAKAIGVTDLAVTYGHETAAPLGFVRMGIDLNMDAGGEYEYLCYKRQHSATNWMSGVAGTRKIAELSIPGTHDTLAYSFKGFSKLATDSAKCQQLTVKEQLEVGVRYFDIRVDRDLDGRHGITVCGTSFEDALKQMVAFLQAYPTEAIFFMLRITSDSGDAAKYVEQMTRIFENSATGYQNYFWRHQPGEKGLPTLDAVRGKFVLLDSVDAKYGYAPSEKGIGVKHGDVFTGRWTEDWNEPDIETKKKNILKHLENSRSDKTKCYGCGVNATGSKTSAVVHTILPVILGPIGWIGQLLTKDNIPAAYAARFNPWVCETIKENYDKTGVMAFDFIDSYVADCVITHNFNPTENK